jgi:hypothetical protein
MTSGLYYKPITIINDDSSIINKLETILIDDARVIIYNHHMFIGQATEAEWKRISYKQSARWQRLFWLKACAFFSL